jgi:signal transduction histidine kinase
MRPFADLPIRRKMILDIVATSSLALVVTAAAVLAYEITTFRPRAVAKLNAQTEIIRMTLWAPLEFLDPDAAAENLATLRANPEISAACVYADDGSVFARYLGPGNEDFPCPPISDSSHRFTGRHLVMFHDITHEGDELGHLFVRYDLPPLLARMPQYGIMIGGVCLAVITMSLLLSITLKRIISGPIYELAQASRSVIENEDYRVRVTPHHGQDEIGELTNAFNKMLATIEQRESALQIELAERRRAEAEINKLNENLEQRVARRTTQLELANKELEAFCYSVSHDLRAPLRSIDGFSHAVLEDYHDQLDEQGQDYLSRIRSASLLMARLIEDLLNLSRTSRMEMSMEMVNLTRIGHEIIGDLRQAEPQRVVELKIAAGLTAYGDPRLMKIALKNLLENAWKFTGLTEHAVIELGVQENKQGQTVFFVQDNGAGFDQAHANMLFGAFQRLHKTTEFPGTGIGLATVQRIIHRHQGKIWARGKVGEGATFFFTLIPPPPAAVQQGKAPAELTT